MNNPRISDGYNPPLTPGWFLPTTLAAFLAILRRTPALGTTDDARLRKFLTLPQAAWMPSSLRSSVIQLLKEP